MTVEDKEKRECCGCNACVEVCPRHCIGMVADKKGFLYPKVDYAVCTDCGACEKVCPIGKDVRLNAPLAAFAAWSRDRGQHLASTSGGAAHVLAAAVIKAGGVVYGCASEGLRIRHIRVESLPELSKLHGSKYVQSDVCGLYSRVRSDLKSGRQVLFIGTPCQVAGLKRFVRNVPDRLLLVDLICHGVPSQQMLQEHVAHVAPGRDIRHIAFRRGNAYVVSLAGEDFRYEANAGEEPYKDMYVRGFLDSMIHRPSCYHCPFAQPLRIADITIGDFWGLQDAGQLPPESKDGISVLLPASDKGMKLVAAVEPELHIVRRSVDEAVRGNTHLRHSSLQGRRSRLFGWLYPTLPFDTAMNIVIADRKGIRRMKDFVYALRHASRRQ